MKAEDLFAHVTDELVAAIEAGAGDWTKPWHRLAAGGLPTNADGRAYRGVNALWLPMVAADHGWGLESLGHTQAAHRLLLSTSSGSDGRAVVQRSASRAR